MATPFNPFGRGRGTAHAGSADTAGRGRGASSARGSQFQSRGSRGRRASKWLGAGQGIGRGRGAGAATTGAPPSGISNAGTHRPEISNSPFAQVKQSQPSTNPFGGQPTQRKSPFPGMTNGTAHAHGAARGPSSQVLQKQSLGRGAGDGMVQSVPVEDASIMASYHERYDQLKLDRAKQRQKAIRDGLMADPNQPTSLNQAITPVGTCTSMCPEFERVERIVQKMVDKSEKYLHPSTNTLQNMETKMLKRFRRSAAGYDEQLPSDIRTPKTLLQSTNYLIRHVVGGGEPLSIIHKFVWDRTRSIRNDFSVQQLTQEDDVKMAVTCLERIARFHIVSLHLLSSPANEEPFDRHQEREQLNNTMLSLMYYYDDNRGRTHFPNEDEFRAYYIIFSIHDQRPDLEARVQKWPASLLNSPRVQVALELYAASCNTWDYQGTLDARRPNAIAQGFYTRFFNIINSPSVSYLMACVAEIYFNHVRQTAIRAIWKGYCRQPASQQHKNEEWTVEELTKVLHFDDDEQTIQFCEEQDLELAENANDQLYLNWSNRPVDSVAFQPSSEHVFSDTYVESKRAGRTLVAVILGMNVREAARMGMIDRSALRPRAKELTQEVLAPQDNTLFVTDEDNQVPAPVVDMISPSLDGERQDSDSSASGIRNPFQKSTPSPPANPFATAQPAMPAVGQPPNPFQTTQPPNPFATMFSGATAQTSTSTTTAPTPNPFAASLPKAPSPFGPSPSPFSFPKRETVAEGGPAAAPPPTTQPSSLFPTSGTAGAASEPPGAKPNPFAASLASWNQPTPFEAGQKEKNRPSTTGQAPLPFSTGGLPTSTPASLAAKPHPFAASSPFATPNLAEPSHGAATQPPSSLFPTARPFYPAEAKESKAAVDSASSTPPTSSSIFTFSKPSQAEVRTSSVTTTTDPGQQLSSVSESVQTSTSKGVGQPSLFAPTAPVTEQKKTEGTPFTPSASVTGMSAPAPLFGPAAGTSTATQGSVLSTANTTAEGLVQKEAAGAQPSKVSPFDQPTEPGTTTPAGSPEPAPTEIANKAQEPKQLVESPPVEATPATAIMAPPTSKKDFTPAPGEPVYETREERKAAWERFIQRRKRQVLEQEQTRSRKRALEAPAAVESAQEEPGSKAAKVSETEVSPPAKYSLAKYYLEELPKLPCLERAKQLLERKPPTEEEIQAAKPTKRQVDEDEMLLNSARIAAEQLRTGPKIFDGYPTYSETRRYSYSPRASFGSFGSSTPYAQSASPPTHRYEIAHAPDTPLGLGRTMSRTEQRIRMTGAHGLAYKPLSFISEKDKKNRFTQSG